MNMIQLQQAAFNLVENNTRQGDDVVNNLTLWSVEDLERLKDLTTQIISLRKEEAASR